MSLLAPLFLVGALLAIGPIIFHLARRSPQKRITFSALRFLQPSPEVVETKRRIQNPWLLFLRCLILALLALAFARPFLSDRDEAATSTSAGRDVALLIDTSASMQRAGVLTAAMERARARIAELGPNDSLAILTFGDRAQTTLDSSVWIQSLPRDRLSLAEAALANISVGRTATKFDVALENGIQAIFAARDGAQQERLAEICLISDMAEGGQVAGLAGIQWPTNTLLRRETVTPNASFANIGLRWLDTSTRDGATQLRIALAHSELPQARDVTLTLRDAMSGEQIGAPLILSTRGTEQTIGTFPLSPEQAARPLVATLEGDDASFDNELPIAPPFLPFARIAYHGEPPDPQKPDAGYFVQKAAAALPALRMEFLRPELNAPIPTADLHIIDRPLTASEAASLRRAAETGSHLIVLVSSDSLQPTLAEIIGTPVGVRSLPNSGARFGFVDYRHPLFAPFADPRFSDFTGIRFWTPMEIEMPASSAAETIARFDDDSAAVIEIPIGSGRALVWGSGWMPQQSQWALSTKFLPWLHRVVIRASGGAPLPNNILAQPDAIEPQLEAGEWTAIADDAPLAAKSPQLGVYQLANDNDRWLAIQMPPEESLSDPISDDEWDALGLPSLSSDNIERLENAISERAALASALEAESRQSLWRWLLAAVAIVLILESAVALGAQRRLSQERTAA